MQRQKKVLKKIQAYTGFKYFTYAIRVLHQYQSMVQILYEPELFQAFFLLHLYLQRSSLHLKQY